MKTKGNKQTKPTLTILTALLLAVLALAVSAAAAAPSHLEVKPVNGAPAGFPALRVPDGLGVNIHYFSGLTTNDLDLIRDAGFRFIREDFAWSRVEKARGVYDFQPYDDLTRELTRRGLRALYILDYGNKLYEPSGMSVQTEAGRQAFTRFAAAAAARYRGQGVVWELWNEPDVLWYPYPPGAKAPRTEEYVALAKAALPAVRNADPQAALIAPAVNRMKFGYLEECFRLGLLDVLDGVSVHPYRAGGPESVVADIGQLRTLIGKYRSDGKPLPVISGEWGWAVLPKAGYASVSSPDQQGHYLARQFLVNLSLGIPISIWYDWRDDGKDPKNMEHNFGVVTHDRQPKPAYAAVQNLTRALDGTHFVKQLDSPPDEWRLLFSDGPKSTLAAWTTGETRATAIPPGTKVQLTQEPQYFPLPPEITGKLTNGE
jgi:hypothetical protein